MGQSPGPAWFGGAGALPRKQSFAAVAAACGVRAQFLLLAPAACSTPRPLPGSGALPALSEVGQPRGPLLQESRHALLLIMGGESKAKGIRL